MAEQDKVLRFGMRVTGKTRAERVKKYQKNWDKAEEAVNEGKVICLSDLMCQAEQLHLDDVDEENK